MLVKLTIGWGMPNRDTPRFIPKEDPSPGGNHEK